MMISRLLNNWRIPLISVGILLLPSCFGGGTIVSDENQEVLEISKTYVVEANLGRGAKQVDTNTNLARYAFRSNGKINSYALLVYPFDLRGRLKLKSEENLVAQKRISEEESRYSEYLDKLLRAHRALLSGHLDASERLITNIESTYDTTYGTDILRGSIALMRGNTRESLKYFERAKTLQPEAVNLPLPGLSSAGGEEP